MDNQNTAVESKPQALETQQDAANAFLGLLSGKTGKQKTQREAPAGEAVADTPSEADGSDEASDETPDYAAATQSEAEDAGSDGEADAEDEGSDENSSEQRLITVEIDGQTVQLPEDEVKQGYLRNRDYTQKTQALANERNAIVAERQAVQQERAQYAQLLPALAQQIAQALPQPPDPALRQSDPVEYMLRKEDYEASMERINAAQYEYQRVASLQQQEQVKAVQTAVAEGFRKLPELVPAWKDPKVFAKDQQALREYGRKLGYSDDELNQAYDPRAVAALYKAMKYDQLAARKPTPDTPLEQVVRPAAVRPDVPAPKRAFNEARKRLKETGHIDDATRAFRALLG